MVLPPCFGMLAKPCFNKRKCSKSISQSLGANCYSVQEMPGSANFHRHTSSVLAEVFVLYQGDSEFWEDRSSEGDRYRLDWLEGEDLRDQESTLVLGVGGVGRR